MMNAAGIVAACERGATIAVPEVIVMSADHHPWLVRSHIRRGRRQISEQITRGPALPDNRRGQCGRDAREVEPAHVGISRVELLLDVAGGGSFTLVPFPEERKRIDIGDFYADISLAKATLGWEPATSLREGLRLTVDYYRRHKQHYL